MQQERMFIIIDGMDQSKINLPHLVRKLKTGVTLWKLRYNLQCHSCMITLGGRLIVQLLSGTALKCRFWKEKSVKLIL